MYAQWNVAYFLTVQRYRCVNFNPHEEEKKNRIHIEMKWAMRRMQTETEHYSYSSQIIHWCH